MSILRSLYSVPSRLVNAKLRALVYANHVELYFGKNLGQEMPRVRPGENDINYRHVIAHLVRKPGAFRNYKYRDELFPTPIFRKSFDCLESAGKPDKEYLKILYVAAMDGEDLVETALGLLLEMKQVPSEEAVKSLLQTRREIPVVEIQMPNLALYDGLLVTELAGAAQ